MPERQGKLGDSWNDCARKLLHFLGWEYVGDKNIDVKGNDGEDYGIDSILIYHNPSKSIKQTVLLESKRYAMNSINGNTISKWLKRLKEKIDGLRNSEELVKEYPVLNDCSSINLGIVMIWIHDANEQYLNVSFQNYLQSVNINTGARPDGSYSRIMVLDNRRITWLCSIIDILHSYDNYEFIYPARIIDDNPVEKNTILTIEYMMSNIVIAECTKDGKTETVVFYLSIITETTVVFIYELLMTFQCIRTGIPVCICYYDKSEKMIEVINSFKEKRKDICLNFRKMNHYSYDSEPACIANND